ncbi:zinc-ribbon domain-containing protein [Brachybacterium sp. FME24]|uniref:zinc-ribbon domain-containing protein n=1 Tax=Brachybacterium sp. FME24 TaxID=2742605 RepID=UPI001868B21C|nr:zinc-ribbon domain-containing protein [Brachybacterium sp. FME24]
MFFIFGIASKQQDLGPGATRACPRCHNTTQWSRVKSFRQFTLFFVIPVARWGRRQYEQCGICGATVEE